MSAKRGNRSVRVDPQRVVALAGRCDDAVGRMVTQWTEVGDELRTACDQLGDATGVSAVVSAYADTLAAADDVVVTLAQALENGVAALIDSARDISAADETVAFEIGRTVGGRGLHRGWDVENKGHGG